MNFLLHVFLAGDDENHRVGGLIGDCVKGPLPAGLSTELAEGVALHRAIDSFADRHPAFLRSRSRIGPARRRWGGVLVDLFYDHLLARDGREHGVDDLSAYVAAIHASVRAKHAELPEKARETTELMEKHGWLFAYRDIAAIGKTIDRMALYRLKRQTTLAGGVEEFLADQEGFADDFHKFLPEAMEFSRRWRNEAVKGEK